MQQPEPVPVEQEVEILPVHVSINSLIRIEYELRSQGLIQEIRTCNGESHKVFRGWLRDMEIVGNAVKHEPERMKALALRTLKGTAADYLNRWLKERPNPTWEELKEQLKERFSDLADAECAKLHLKQLKQASGESVQTFSERITEMADQIYMSAKITQPLLQAQLKDQFLEGCIRRWISFYVYARNRGIYLGGLFLINIII